MWSGIQFFTYGNTKAFLVNYIGLDKDSSFVHLVSSAIAGLSLCYSIQYKTQTIKHAIKLNENFSYWI
jgi:hypothetical protein